MPKPEFEFFAPTAVAWTPVAGSPGLVEKILSRDDKTGDVTRLLRFSPGADTAANGTLTHDFWEEVWILEGSMYDTAKKLNITAGMYACRPPGMPHGPWRSDAGCMTFEVRYRK